MSIEKLGQYLVAVEDPRCSGKVEHRLVEVLVIAVCAVIACAESFLDLAIRAGMDAASPSLVSWATNGSGHRPGPVAPGLPATTAPARR